MSESIENMYETSGELDAKLMADIAWKSTWYHLRTMYLLLPLLLINCCYLLYEGSESGQMMLILCIALTVMYIFFPKLVTKRMYATFREQAPGGTLQYTTSFSAHKLHLQNHTNGARTEVDMVLFNRVFQVADVWALISKGNIIYPVFASQLSETDRESLLALLKQNNPKIKIRLPKKK